MSWLMGREGEQWIFYLLMNNWCMLLRLYFRHLASNSHSMNSAWLWKAEVQVTPIKQLLTLKRAATGAVGALLLILKVMLYHFTLIFLRKLSSLRSLPRFLGLLLKVNFHPAKTGFLLSVKRWKNWNFQTPHYVNPLSAISHKTPMIQHSWGKRTH